MSTFEQLIENTNLNANRRDEDAHAAEVSIFEDFEDDGEVRL